MFKMLISAGHGAGAAHNRGSVCSNEGDNNYYFSLELKKAMEQYENVQIDLVRNNISDNPTVAQRAAMGKGYNLYYSIHSNAAVNNPIVRGTEVWDSVEKPNKALAKAICDVVSELFGHNNRGVKYREGQPGLNWYGELRHNGADSAIIVEHGFHTNQQDCNFFKNNHKKITEAVAEVIAKHYRLKKKSAAHEPSPWAKEAWEWAVKEGLLDGTNPTAPMTREMFAMVEYRKRDVK